MPRTKLLSLILLTCFVHNSAQAELQNCPDLEPPRHGGMASGQAGAAIMGPLKTVMAPKRKVPFPKGSIDSVRISLDRTECYGSCPSYTIELMGDGSASYEGRSFVLVAGHHSYDVPKDDVECLLTHFRKASFWSLADKYVADITDGPTYTISLTIGGQTKTIVDYFGRAVGMPATITALEEEIDRIGGVDRWVKATDDTIPSLQKEGFDFHSQAAATMLANSVYEAPDDFIFALMEAGAPVTGRARPLRVTAVEAASRAGRLAIVQALIARGAFLNGPPDVKEAALRGATYSGNPRVVAEILKYNPDVNAQALLIEIERYSSNKPDSDIVAVVRLLLDAKADVNIADVFGNTALFGLDNAEVVNLLIRAGADVNHANRNGQTALFRASNAKVVNLLIRAGADVNRANKNGETALFWVSNEEVVNLLIGAGGQVNIADENGMTPLLSAQSDEAAVALIQAGADTGVKAKSGLTIQKYATERKFVETLQLLRKLPR